VLPKLGFLHVLCLLFCFFAFKTDEVPFIVSEQGFLEKKKVYNMLFSGVLVVFPEKENSFESRAQE